MRKRLIYRCDDVGYTEAYDLGIFKVIDANIGCSADVMFDAPHAAEALKQIKERPWLSVGWHRHLWESPVLPPEEVPSMVDAEGRFKWRHKRDGGQETVTYEDAYKEFRAEMELCYSILGKYPDTAGIRENGSELEKAFAAVVKECGIAYNIYTMAPDHPMGRGGHGPVVDPKWADKHIVSANAFAVHGFDMKYWDEYQPINTLTALQWTDAEEIYFYGWHPGFVDDHILAESTCHIHRVREHQAAVSAAYSKWIIENHIELINFRDALYGTSEFQNHLKAVDSPLWLGNM